MTSTLAPTGRPSSLGLSALASDIAMILADVVAAAGSKESGAAETAGFLRDWATTRDATALSGPDPLCNVVERYGLTDPERDLLLLAGLPEEHEGLAATFRAMGPIGEPWPTLGIAALVLERKEIDRHTLRRIISTGQLCGQGIVRIGGNAPLFEQVLRPAPGIWTALHGHRRLPDAVRGVDIGAVPPGLARWSALPAVQRAAAALTSPGARTVLVQSQDETVGLARCAALGETAGVQLIAGRAKAYDGEAIRLLALHAAAHNAVALLVVDPLTEPAAGSAVLDIDDVPGPLLVCAPPGSLRVGRNRPVILVPLGPVTPADRRDAWSAALPEFDSAASYLAARHPLDPALTVQVALDARAGYRLGDGDTDVSGISGLIRARAGVSLPAGVELLTPSVPWERLILPDDAGVQLHEAVSRLEHQAQVLEDWYLNGQARASRGCRLLLTGPPGTGKSLAAEALATAAKTDLLQIDASQMVSKWIGETEKNLAAAFDVAERTQAVLFVDEADWLFAARTEVSDAHDRYANLETAYLLQRLDRFDGLVLLASNLRNNIDGAFLRRMDFVIDLPLPDEPARLALWSLHLPAGHLADDVDLDVLARLYPVTGAAIRNASIAAAFMAASENRTVTQNHLITAVRREYTKAAMPFPGEPSRRRNDL
ncbi:ATP-binding protein [Mycobacterium sp. NPDC004974]